MTTARRRLSKAFHSVLDRRDITTTKDISLERQRQALASTARFVDEHMSMVPAIHAETPLEAMLELIRRGVDLAPSDGLVLEFGVATGLTLREIAGRRLPAHGFDSFEGLPENWRDGYGQGAFAQQLPEVNGAELHVGWFSDTLPGFLADHPEPIAFVHLDADLYSSTKTVFDLAFDRFVPGTVIVFDEYFNYPGWQQHEHKAFNEFLERYSGGFEWINYNAMHEQVTVRLT